MIIALFFILLALPLSANAYIGPAIAGIFGTAIGLGGIIVISLVFMLAWPVAKLFLAFKRKEKGKNKNKKNGKN